MSALPPKADIGTRSWNVRFVPKADSCTAAILPPLLEVLTNFWQQLAGAERFRHIVIAARRHRRFFDLCSHHIQDISRGLGKDVLSEAQVSLIKRASSIECELERLDALLSLGEAVNLNEYGRATSHLRR